MDDITLHELRQQNHLAWRSFTKQLRLLAVKACDNTNDDMILDEVVQESSIALAIKLQSESFQLSSKLSTFMYSVARNQFLKLVRKRGIQVELNDDEMADDPGTSEELIERESRFKKVEQAFNLLGKKCSDILRAYYFEQKRMEVIAIDLGYLNGDTVKNLKSRCFKDLKDLTGL